MRYLIERFRQVLKDGVTLHLRIQVNAQVMRKHGQLSLERETFVKPMLRGMEEAFVMEEVRDPGVDDMFYDFAWDAGS